MMLRNFSFDFILSIQVEYHMSEFKYYWRSHESVLMHAGFTRLVKGKIPYLPFNGLGCKGAKCIVFSVFLSDKGLNEQ